MNKDENSKELGYSEYDKIFIKNFFKSMRKVAILSMIKAKPRHGYEIMNVINKIYSEHSLDEMKIGASTIYPLLHTLEERNLIKGTWHQQGKRDIKCYEITPEGEATILRTQNLIKNSLYDFWEETEEDETEKEKE
jgi:DNA-binding PadR family transcriptional regulator